MIIDVFSLFNSQKMELEITETILLVLAGVAAGFINTVAGGGSLLTLPLLIFFGLPPVIANGSNRIAILLQNILGVAGFKSKGVFVFPFSLWVGLSALAGALIGAKIGVSLSGETFNRILAIVMLAVVLIMIFNPIKTNSDTSYERTDTKHHVFSIIAFFFVGIYGGFIQAGVGFIMMASLTFINRFTLVKTNSIKVFVVFIYTWAALGVFIYEGKVNWPIGLILALGNMTGAWIGSRWSVAKGDVWIKRFMLVMVTVMAIKLWFY